MKELFQLRRKKQFIHWFLQAHALKKPEAAKILNFLLENDSLLGTSHFVEDIRHIPNAILISSQDAVTVNFLCRLNGEYYEDIDKIVHSLKSTPPEQLYIRLSFDREFLCSLCGDVLEAKPEHLRNACYFQVVVDLEKEIAGAYRRREERRAHLLAAIDEALEREDREAFLRIAGEYKNIFLDSAGT